MGTPKLLLYCDSGRRKFTLRFEGAADSDSFSSSEQALQFASTLVQVETPLHIFDLGGKVLIKTTVLPA